MTPCPCSQSHAPRRVVLTGGPGAGKTAVLELVRRSLCEHVKVLPEAASVVFGGGFPRSQVPGAREAAQRAIFYVQRELENASDAENPAIVLCDRGTMDGTAYCADPEVFLRSVGTSIREQFGRYAAVIHLRTPTIEQGYNHQNPLRVEDAQTAAALDERIGRAWEGHPHVMVVENAPDFLAKASRALALIRDEMPECCRGHFRATAPSASVAESPVSDL